jgi:hypothetical protein
MAQEHRADEYREVEYKEEIVQYPADWKTRLTRDILEAKGPCPGCGADLHGFTATSFFAHAKTSSLKEIVVTCSCYHDHSGAAGAKGCGRTVIVRQSTQKLANVRLAGERSTAGCWGCLSLYQRYVWLPFGKMRRPIYTRSTSTKSPTHVDHHV